MDWTTYIQPYAHVASASNEGPRWRYGYPCDCAVFAFIIQTGIYQIGQPECAIYW